MRKTLILQMFFKK